MKPLHIIIPICALAALAFLNTPSSNPRRELFEAAVRQFDIMIYPTIRSVELNLATSMRDTAVHAYIDSDHNLQTVKEALDIEQEDSRRWMATEWLERVMVSFFASKLRIAFMCNSTFNLLEMQKQCSASCTNHTVSLMPATVLIANRAIMAGHSRHMARMESQLIQLKEELLHEDVLAELEAQTTAEAQTISKFIITLCVTGLVCMSGMMLYRM
jgi:hypothetical protein